MKGIYFLIGVCVLVFALLQLRSGLTVQGYNSWCHKSGYTSNLYLNKNDQPMNCS